MFMIAAYWFVKEEMPVSKFSRLIMLLKLSKCPDIESMYEKEGKRKVQGLPQSQTAALSGHQEEEETDKSKQAQIEQTYKKH